MLRSVFLGLALCTTTLAATAQNPSSIQPNQANQPNQQQSSPLPGQPSSVPQMEDISSNNAPVPPTFAPGAGGYTAGDGVKSAPRMVRVSGGVMESQNLTKVPPVYPAQARANHIEGTVLLSARIGKDGHVENLAVVSGPMELQRSAVDAVKNWTYKVYRLNGQAVEVNTMVAINFHLE